MARCVIFGAAEFDTETISLLPDDYIIAADGGLKALERTSIEPHLIVGDFDSYEKIPDKDNIIRLPVKKDDTDTIFAIKTALNKGYKTFVFYGCIGGRLDHTLANLQAATFIAENNGNAVFIDGIYSLTVIKNSSITFSADCKGTVSAFAVYDKAYGVTEKGLLYSLDNAELTPAFPLGVSNEFIGKEAIISVKNGVLCIIWRSDSGFYKIGG